MKRLTTDSPDGNFETMMNFVYGKDGWAYIRHDGEHSDVLLTDWAKRQCLLRGCDEVLAETPEEIDQRLCDCMMDDPICPIAMAYCFASQAVHLRSRLKMHEDTMPLERAQELDQAETDGRLVVLPPNDPLTLEELREMDREPVWLSGDGLNRYDIFRGERSHGWADFYCGRLSLCCYGKDWLAYRRKPEEGTE